jgi:hypothetical protein
MSISLTEVEMAAMPMKESINSIKRATTRAEPESDLKILGI